MLMTLMTWFIGHISARDFSYTYEGQTVVYTVTDESSKTCETKAGENSTGNMITGSLQLPESPMDENGVVYHLTGIGNYSFYECVNLEGVTLPNSIISIGNYAFAYSSIKEVTIPNAVSTIGKMAFYGCNNLITLNYNAENCEINGPDNHTSPFSQSITTLKIGDSVKSIPDYAFSWCTGLNNLQFGNSLTAIGDYSFTYCTGLQSVNLPEGLSTIGENAFSNCSSVESLSIPESVTTIGRSAFNNCNKLRVLNYSALNCSAYGNAGSPVFPSYLEEIIISDKVRSIPDYAFYGCKKLNSLVMGKSITSIGNYAFFDCSALSEVKMPNLIEVVGKSAFQGCSNLSELILSSSLDTIHEYAFRECIVLPEVTIPESVTTIGNGAFYGCEKLIKVNYNASECTACGGIGFDAAFPKALEQLTIGNNVKAIPDCAFYGCELLNGVVFPSSLTSIGDDSFSGCRNLSEVILPNSITSIGQRAFNGCRGLVELVIPNSITSINEATFKDCSSLSQVTIPDMVTLIDKKAFAGCFSINNLKIGNAVIEIADSAFTHCSGLKEVDIPVSVKKIGKEAFFWCLGLNNINFSNSILSIGEDAFKACSSLKNVEISDLSNWSKSEIANEMANPIFYAKQFTCQNDTIEKLILDLGSDGIYPYAFINAHNLSKVNIKAAEIGDQAFGGCKNIAYLCIDVERIGSLAFVENTKMKEVYCLNSVPPMTADSVFTKYDGVTLYVPEGTVNNYEESEYCWRKFSDIQESDFSELDKIFSDEDTSSITNLTSDNSKNSIISNDIYNLQGICLKRNATEEDLRSLTPGLYIIGGRKVIIQ